LYKINYDSKLLCEKGEIAPYYKLGLDNSNKKSPVYKVVHTGIGNKIRRSPSDSLFELRRGYT